MKSPAFDYIRADSPQHAFELLAKHGDDARVIAGGQTLLATLNMRLSQPALLVDIAGFDAWRGIAVQGGLLRIGSLAQLLRDIGIPEGGTVAIQLPNNVDSVIALLEFDEQRDGVGCSIQLGSAIRQRARPPPSRSGRADGKESSRAEVVRPVAWFQSIRPPRRDTWRRPP